MARFRLKCCCRKLCRVDVIRHRVLARGTLSGKASQAMAGYFTDMVMQQVINDKLKASSVAAGHEMKVIMQVGGIEPAWKPLGADLSTPFRLKLHCRAKRGKMRMSLRRKGVTRIEKTGKRGMRTSTLRLFEPNVRIHFILRVPLAESLE